MEIPALLVSLVASIIGLIGANLKVRDTFDYHAEDLARQGRWIAWSACLQTIAIFLMFYSNKEITTWLQNLTSQ
jgi:hypothetical protein